MRRGYLGVNTQRVHLPEEIRNELEQKSGLLIVSVEPNSPAAQGGLNLGDTIVGFGDAAIRRHDDLLVQLSGDKVGTAVAIKILRGGKVETVEVTVGEKE
jgi:serine protease Do